MSATHANGFVTGDLAADSENDERLREMLRIFLGCGSSYKLVRVTGVHLDTVKYRVGRAEARRGRPIAEERLAVELALLVCHWYGAGSPQAGLGVARSRGTTTMELCLLLVNNPQVAVVLAKDPHTHSDGGAPADRGDRGKALYR